MFDTTSYSDKLPNSLNEVLKSFTGNECVMVRYLKPKDGIKGKEGRCHFNVRDFVQKHGGSSVSGWILFRDTKGNENGFYVWSFHSVWLTPENKLVDVTEDKNYLNRDKSIFVPDSNREPNLIDGLLYNNFLVITDSNFAQFYGKSIGKEILSNTPYWCDKTTTKIMSIDEHSGIYRLIHSDYKKNIEKMCEETDCDFIDRKLVPRNENKTTAPINLIFDYNISVG
jgi:hypothetical protein